MMVQGGIIEAKMRQCSHSVDVLGIVNVFVSSLNCCGFHESIAIQYIGSCSISFCVGLVVEKSISAPLH